MSDPLQENEALDKQVERICQRARRVVEIVDHRINEHREEQQKTSYPYAPSVSDFMELMGLEVKREILNAKLELAEVYSEPLKFVLKHRLAQVEWKIAARDIT
jgi:hypothetical protein